VTDEASVVSQCLVRRNGGPGISTGPDGRIAENVISANGGAGISAPSSTLSDRNSVNHNGAPSVAGSRNRRFYLTQNKVVGSQALNACAPGYHFASLWEIHDTSALVWDTERGVLPLSPLDLGLGPPSNTGGWVRTGFVGISGATSGPGTKNCIAWTSGSGADLGTEAFLESEWASAPQATAPWKSLTQTCASLQQVWCVED